MKGLLLALLLGAWLPGQLLVKTAPFFKASAAGGLHQQGAGVPPGQHPAIRQIAPDKETGSALAVVVEEVPLAHTTQILPLNKNGRLVGNRQVARQVMQVLDNLSAVLQAAGSGMDQLVKVNVYLAEPGLIAGVQKQLGRRLAGKTKPAVSYVVGELAHAGALVAMDAIAAAAPTAPGRSVAYWRSPTLYGGRAGAHAALLPAGGVVYVSGQADKGDLLPATRGTLQQLGATLTQLNLGKQQVVQLKAFTRPMADVRLVEKEIAAFFTGTTMPPVVYVDWLSKDPVIEIELIAASPAHKPQPAAPLDFITPQGMSSSPVYSRVTRINYGKKVYVSGLYGKTAGNARQEVTEIFAALGDILQQAGSDFRHLAKATYYVSNDQTSTQLNALRPQYYDPQRPPAASKAMVKGVGQEGLGITLDMIGVVPH
jgi:enamine deaminase RidA (YjgF/YER057c/UK114 family)